MVERKKLWGGRGPRRAGGVRGKEGEEVSFKGREESKKTHVLIESVGEGGRKCARNYGRGAELQGQASMEKFHGHG